MKIPTYAEATNQVIALPAVGPVITASYREELNQYVAVCTFDAGTFAHAIDRPGVTHLEAAYCYMAAVGVLSKINENARFMYYAECKIVCYAQLKDSYLFIAQYDQSSHSDS